ncbi:hypothetical protein BDAP_002831 [Binucleata daphniae]
MNKLNYECTDQEFFNYCNCKIDEDYKNIEEVLNNIESIYTKYSTSALFNTFITKLLLEKNRTKLTALIAKYSDLYNNLSYQLLTSKHYQHRLVLVELLSNKKVENNDKFFIKKLLNDKITVVQKKIIKCVKKELFSDDEILEILSNMYESDAYVVTGACPFLLTQLKNTHVKTWFDKMIKDESWLVRYNLCKFMNEIKHENEFEYGEVFTNDEIIEIRSLFCTIIKKMKVEKNKYIFYKKMLNDKEDKIRYVCVKEIECVIDNTDDICTIKYCLFLLKNKIDDNSLDIRVKICEIFAKNIHRMLQSKYERETELHNFFNNEMLSNTENQCINNIFVKIDDFDFILPFIESFLLDKKWRIRNKCVEILKMLSNVGKCYIVENLLYFHISILNDQINEIRSSGLELLSTFVNEHGSSILTSYKEELKKMASNEKYAIRLLCIKILDIIVEREINEELLSLVLEIVDLLMLDNLTATKNELIKVLRKLDRYDWYDNKIYKFILQLCNDDKSRLHEIIIE